MLNRLIDQPGFGDTAVIVNEFGEAGVDGALVTQADERAFAMSVGCLCCTVSGDVRLTLLRILEEAEKRQMPTELVLLPIVESAFQPFAYSHGRAAGLWQFIPSFAIHTLYLFLIELPG